MFRGAATFSRRHGRPTVAMWIAALAVGAGAVIVPPGVLPAVAGSPAGTGLATQVVDLHQVSGPSPFAQSCSGATDYDQAFEPGAAVDPRDHSRGVVGWIQDQTTDSVVAHTADVGRTWSLAPAPGIGPCEKGLYAHGYDPWTAWGPDGRVYLSSGSNGRPTGLPAPLDPDPFDGSVMVNTSTDGGTTWSSPSIVARDQDNGFIIDKPMVATDPARAGVAYALWSRIDVSFAIGELGFSHTANGGVTWSTPRLISPTPPATVYNSGGLIVVLPNGHLVLLAVQVLGQPQFNVQRVFVGDTQLVSMTSTDDGTTWSSPVNVGQLQGTLHGVPPFPSATADKSGRVDIVWGTSVYFSAPSDEGRRWSATSAQPFKKAVKPFVPTIATNDAGSLAVTYYDNRNDQAGATNITDYWLSTSTDGGGSWAETHVAGPVDLSKAPPSNGAGGQTLGDYESVLPQPDGFLTLFCLAPPASSGGAVQVFSARLVQTPLGGNDSAGTGGRSLPKTQRALDGGAGLWLLLLGALAVSAGIMFPRPGVCGGGGA